MDATRIPMRWPCGALEIERAMSQGRLAPRDVEALRLWSEPAMLERLAGSPVDCLVVPWAEGSARDTPHQHGLAPLVAAARQRGLSLVGWASERADPRSALQSARGAGLHAVATAAPDAPNDPAVLRFGDVVAGVAAARGGFLGALAPSWPGPKLETRPDADAETGPTGPPWLNSNAWYVRLARALADPEVLWLTFDPPDVGQALEAAAYAQAVADTCVFGGRWLVSLDQWLRASLAAGEARARESWAALARSLAFFERHRDWARYEAAAQLGVVSEYAGANAFLASEVLNLIARQGGLSRVLERSRVTAASLDGLDAVLYVDAAAPERDLAGRLYAYAEKGGTLITPPGWEKRGAPVDGPLLPRFDVRRLGAGRLAVALDDFADPYLVAEDAQLVMSHRHDRLRIFNPGTAQSHYATSADGRRGVLHTLAYQPPDARTPMGVWFRRAWSEARAWSFERETPAPVAPTSGDGGVAFLPPPVSVYSALELLG